MGQEQFIAMMPYIIADLVGMITEKKGITESEAISRLYESNLYADLECEDTKVWHYSTEMLYSLFTEEEQTGSVRYPDV